MVTAGYGSAVSTDFNSLVSTNDYVTAAMDPEGSLAIVYSPFSKTMTVDLSKFSGSVTSRWYDVENGYYRRIIGSPFVNVGKRQFTTPGLNSGGDPDWVLVLEAEVPNVVPPVLRISTADTGYIVISFDIVAGQKYELESRVDLDGGWWSAVDTGHIGPEGSIDLVLSNELSEPERFYRVRTWK